jgi:hypothetical protein
VNGKVYWLVDGRRTNGRIESHIDSISGRYLFVRWFDGTRGRFIEGHEPKELHHVLEGAR